MKNVVIIGGGVAGLSAGIKLQKSGYNTVICEKHYCLGGNLTGWDRGGVHIDNCIHWLTGTNGNSPYNKLWKEIGMIDGENVFHADRLYTYERQGKTLSLWRDTEKLKSEMLYYSVGDETEIFSFIEAVETVRGACGTLGAEEDRKLPFFELIKRAPAMFKYVFISTKGLADRFRSPMIKGFLSSFLSEEFSALALISVFACFTGGDGGVPRGGSKRAADRIAEKYFSLGGRAITGKAVERVNVEDRNAVSVTLSDGSVIPADGVVITAEPKTVFDGKMLSSPMPKDIKRFYDSDRLKRFSAMQCAFVVEGGPPFKGDIIFDLCGEERMISGRNRIIFKEYSHEPRFAPDGKTVVQSMEFCDEAFARDMIVLKRQKSAYTFKKRSYGERVQEIFTKKYPQFKGKITLVDVWTPATYNRYVGTEVGSFLSFTLPEKYLPRMAKSKLKGYDNVYLAGQFLQPPGGLPIAMTSGIAAAENLIKDAKKVRQSKASGIKRELDAVR